MFPVFIQLTLRTRVTAVALVPNHLKDLDSFTTLHRSESVDEVEGGRAGYTATMTEKNGIRECPLTLDKYRRMAEHRFGKYAQRFRDWKSTGNRSSRQSH